MCSFRPVDVTSLPQVAPIDQPAPMLEWLAIERLVVDDHYQRPLSTNNWRAIQKIAEEFRWSRFTPVLVAPIENGLFAIIDGQHRTHAAALCGFTAVPAMAVHMTRAEQASAFTWVNGQTIRITPHQVYRAALSAGETWAERCHLAVANAGCELLTYVPSNNARKPGQIVGIGFVRDMVKAGHAEAITAALTALRAIDTTGRVPLYNDAIIRPFVRALAARPDCQRLDLAEFLRRHDPYKILQRADRLRSEGKATTTQAEFARLLANFQSEVEHA